MRSTLRKRHRARIGRFAVVLTLGLAACGSEPPAPPAPDVSLLRNPTAPLASQADVTAADLSGTWVVRQRVEGAWPRTGETVRFATRGSTLLVREGAVTCSGADRCDLPYVAGAAGRFTLAVPIDGLSVPSEIWVHWMDFDDRTVALGSPDADFVVILDRSATGGADRITAARDILDWYGYDLDVLR